MSSPPETLQKPSFWSQIDLQDVLFFIGATLFLGGIASFSVRIAAIVAGLLCFVVVWAIERAKKAAKGK